MHAAMRSCGGSMLDVRGATAWMVAALGFSKLFSLNMTVRSPKSDAESCPADAARSVGIALVLLAKPGAGPGAIAVNIGPTSTVRASTHKYVRPIIE